jgi:hypothetical protein
LRYATHRKELCLFWADRAKKTKENWLVSWPKFQKYTNHKKFKNTPPHVYFKTILLQTAAGAARDLFANFNFASRHRGMPPMAQVAIPTLAAHRRGGECT